MPRDFYPDMEGDSANESEDNKSMDEKPATETFLAPKSIVPHEPEVGDVCEFRVVAIHDEEIEFEYVKEEEKPKSTMDESMDDMGKMADKGTTSGY